MNKSNFLALINIVDQLEEWQLGSLLNMLSLANRGASYNALYSACLFQDNTTTNQLHDLIEGLGNVRDWLGLSESSVDAVVALQFNSTTITKSSYTNFLMGLMDGEYPELEYMREHGEYYG